MTTFELRTSGRQFRRQFIAAIRGSLIRALTELITNSDDSYRRQAVQHLQITEQPAFGEIMIDYDRKHRRIAVVDWAEGMDADDMRRMIPNYGAATSGLYQDQSVRGYFGKGLKDVLFSMDNGLVESIKQDQLYTAHFYWRDANPTVTIDEQSQPATRKVRDRVSISEGNGTRVSFEIPMDLNLPRHDTLLKNLANYYMLRLINSSKSRKITLHTQHGKGQQREDLIRYYFPNGEMILEDSFTVPFANGFPTHLKLFRAADPLT